MGTPSNIALGPGILRVAPLGTAEPTSASSTPDAAYREIGYTEEGSTFTTELESEDIEVAEELDPVLTVNVRRITTLAFSMAEATLANLALAMNRGADFDDSVSSFDAPGTTGEQRCMILWDSDYGSRWLYRKCYATGSLEVARQKSPDKSLIPVEFRIEVPDSGAPWTVWKHPATGRI